MQEDTKNDGLRIAHSLKKAARLVDCSEPQMRNEIRKGRLRAKTQGRKVLILDADLRDYIRGLADWVPANQRINSIDSN